MPPPTSFSAPSLPPLAAGAPPPPWAAPPWVPPPSVPPPARPSRFDVVGRANTSLLVAALVVGLTYDVATHNGLVTLAGTALVVITVGALVSTSHVVGWRSRALLGVAAVLSLSLTLRSSPGVIGPVVGALAVLLLLAASFGRSSSLRVTFPGLGGRIAIASGHLVFAPGMLRNDVQANASTPRRRGRARSVLRGLGLATPVVLVIGALLGAADPVFQSWFNPPRLFQHLMLVAAGAWGLLGLCRAASAKDPAPELAPAPTLGTVETASVLAALCALYLAFVVAQFVALAGGATHVLATQGLTYADYARRGFFQLLAAAALTVVVLLSLRACADRTRTVLVVLSEAAVALTIGVVVVAVRRLALYESAYGLTMLRLGSTLIAVWIGLVFMMVAVVVARRHSPGLWLAPAVVLSGVVFIGGWAVANPAAIVARTNLSRASHGHDLDVAQAVGLGPDAVPALIGKIGTLAPADRLALLQALCAAPNITSSGAAYNRSKASSYRALNHLCSSRDAERP